MVVDADYTLDDLFNSSIEVLNGESPSPGSTYEVAPGIVGEMGYPTLEDRETVREARSGLTSLFREDATSEDFQALSQIAKGEEPEEGKSPIREDVTAAEFTQITSEANCEATARLLDFEEEVEPHDIVPGMAAVVVKHFSRLRAGLSEGHATEE